MGDNILGYENCEAIIIHDKDLPLIEIKKTLTNSSYEEYEFDESIKNSMGNIFAQFPQTIYVGTEAINDISSKRYVVEFSEEISKKLKSGEYSLLQRKDNSFQATAINNKHKFIENARIAKIEFDPKVITAVTWQIMAFITAQRFLVEINAKLESIDKGIKDILHFLERDKVSKIQGNFDYLFEVENKIKSNKINEKEKVTVANQLENINRAFYQDEKFYLNSLSNLIKELKIKKPSLFRYKKIKLSNITQIKKFKEISYNIIQILYGELKVLQLKAALQLDCYNDLTSRLNNFKERAKLFIEETNKMLNSFHDVDTNLYMEELSMLLYNEKNEINKIFIPLKKVEKEIQFRIAHKESKISLEVEIDSKYQIVNIRKIQKQIEN